MTEKRRLIPVMRDWPGYSGKFVRDQALDAIPNGQKVVKINSFPSDLNEDGATGVILGSIDVVRAAPELASRSRCRYVYFVEWDASPKVAVGIRDFRIGRPS